jgi:hypothetical protein
MILRFFKSASEKLEQTDLLPSLWDIVLAVCLSVAITAADIYFSVQQGSLAIPPIYDGIGSIVDAKRIFYSLNDDPLPGIVKLMGNRNPLWIGLMLPGLFFFGDGEWQYYLARLYPTVGLLLLMTWLVRRRAGAIAAWVCLGVTALLPTVSVWLRSGIDETKNPWSMVWYLRDLRPDFLFAVLLLWAIAILVEQIPTLNRSSLLLSGSFVGLAILCKSSTMLALLIIWGLAIALILGLGFPETKQSVKRLGWLLVPPVLILIPWVLAGGFRLGWDYLYQTMVTNRQMWAPPKQTPLLELLRIQWALFAYHMGTEGWSILGLGTVGFVVSGIRKQVDRRSLIYLLLGITYYLLVSLNPVSNGNLFFCQPYIFFLWVFAWVSLAPVLQWLSQHWGRFVLLLMLGLYCTLTLGHGLNSTDRLVGWGRGAIQQRNVETFQQIGQILKSLPQTDCFVPLGLLTSLHLYYAINDRGELPPSVYYYSTDANSVASKAIATASKCSIILTYSADSSEEGVKNATVSPLGKTATDAIRDWVRQQPQFKLVGEYPYFQPHNLSYARLNNLSLLKIQVYARQG